MSGARQFSLRRHLNALQRLHAQRCYATAKTSHTPEEQAAFLRAHDQKALLETQDHIDNLISHVNKVKEQLASLPMTVSGPAIWDPNDKTKIQTREVKKYPRSIPPYTIGWLRSRIAETPKRVEEVVKRANHVKDHLIDLQHEPYVEQSSDESSSTTLAWQTEISKMSLEEREERLKDMQLEEQAAYARLKGDSERLVRTVNDIRSMGEKSGSLDLDAPEKAPNPFLTADGRKKVNATTTPTPGREKDGKGREGAPAVPDTPATPTTPPPRPVTLGIADLQKQLERSLK